MRIVHGTSPNKWINHKVDQNESDKNMYIKSDAQERALIEEAIREAEETYTNSIFHVIGEVYVGLKTWYIKNTKPMKALSTRENVRGHGQAS